MEVLVIIKTDEVDAKPALPGGKVSPYEDPKHAAYRELWEETRAYIPADEEDQKHYYFMGFHDKMPLTVTYYKGYSDDDRTSDVAWLETTAYGSHATDNINLPQYNIKFDNGENTVIEETNDGMRNEPDTYGDIVYKYYGPDHEGAAPKELFAEPSKYDKHNEADRIAKALKLDNNELVPETESVFWLPVNRHISMTANHRSIVKRAAKHHNCFW